MELLNSFVSPDTTYISTHLPAADNVKRLVMEAHERFQSVTQGQNSQVYPALARVRSDLFGICVVGTTGSVFSVGDAEYEFSIMSVSKPFMFALICDLIGAAGARDRLGVNSTGYAFNSLAGLERSPDGRTNRW